MATFDFRITTEALAHEMDRVTRNVNTMGTAVGAMEAAVIASEKEASDTICRSIDSGFYMLLRSRLSQKLAQCASTMNSRVGSMMETADAIDRTHQQMVGDFNRIKSRYVKLFDNLDRNLDDRVRELDREAMDLANRRTSILVDMQAREAPSVLYYTSDVHGVALKASTAKMKSRAVESIGQLGSGAEHVVELNKKTNAVYDTHVVCDRVTPVLVPVVYANEESVASPGSYALTVHTPTDLDPHAQAQIATEIRRREGAASGSETKNVPAIRAAYLERLNSTQMDPRVSQTMVQLFNASFGLPQGYVQQKYQAQHQAPYQPAAPGAMPGASTPYGPTNGGVS